MTMPMRYADAPQKIRDEAELLVETYGTDPALLQGAIVAHLCRATEDEREACARMVQGFDGQAFPSQIAAAIRLRGVA